MIRKKLELEKLRPRENNANVKPNREDMSSSRRRRLSRLPKERKKLRPEEPSRLGSEKRKLSKIESKRNREKLSKPKRLKLPKTHLRKSLKKSPPLPLRSQNLKQLLSLPLK